MLVFKEPTQRAATSFDAATALLTVFDCASASLAECVRGVFRAWRGGGHCLSTYCLAAWVACREWCRACILLDLRVEKESNLHCEIWRLAGYQLPSHRPNELRRPHVAERQPDLRNLLVHAKRTRDVDRDALGIHRELSRVNHGVTRLWLVYTIVYDKLYQCLHLVSFCCGLSKSLHKEQPLRVQGLFASVR